MRIDADGCAAFGCFCHCSVPPPRSLSNIVKTMSQLFISDKHCARAVRVCRVLWYLFNPSNK